MRLRNLKWLALLAPLGALGSVLHQPLFYTMFGFSVFVPLFWADERADANLGRAAAISYTLTLVALVIAFILIGVGQTRVWTGMQFFKMFTLMLAATYIVHVVSFVASYLYYEFRGA